MTEDTHPSGPLRGIRVLDIGTMLAGPFAATLLADFGAEVIKVEIPGRGDTLRRLGPVNEGGDSYWFSADARNKKSITLDLRIPEAQQILLRLAEKADVLVENFVPGTLDRWGIGAAVLRERNPRLIVSHASGFGQTGPYSGRPGYDRIGVAFGGLWHLSAEPGRQPIRPGTSMADYMTGLFGAFGIMMALYHRDASGGGGQEVDTALYESVFRAMEYTAVHYSATGVVRGPTGNAGPAAPSGAFQAGDGTWLAIAVAEDAMYVRIMKAIGRDDLATDPRYTRAPGRLADREPIEDALRAWVGARTAEDAMAALRAADIPVGPSLSIAEIFEDAQYEARGMIEAVDDPVHGPIRMQGVTPKLSETPGSIRQPAPLLGEHNDEVYGELLGMTVEEIAHLRAAGII